MRDDPRPVNDRDLFEDRNALTGDGPEGELLGPVGTFRRRVRPRGSRSSPLRLTFATNVRYAKPA